MVREGFNPLTLGAISRVLTAGEASGHYGVEVVSSDGGLVRSSAGLQVATQPPSAGGPRAYDIVVAVDGGGERHDATSNRPMMVGMGDRGSRIYAFGDGLRIVESSGSPAGAEGVPSAARLAGRSLDVRIIERRGDLRISPGSCAAVDVALIIVEEDLGTAVALSIASTLHMASRREAEDHATGSVMSLQIKAGAKFASVIRKLKTDPRGDLSVEDLALHCGMSLRTFARHFTREVGLTPARAVAQFRLAHARSLLKQGGLTLKAVAEASGFGSELRLRRAMLRETARAPTPFDAGARDGQHVGRGRSRP